MIYRSLQYNKTTDLFLYTFPVQLHSAGAGITQVTLTQKLHPVVIVSPAKFDIKPNCDNQKTKENSSEEEKLEETSSTDRKAKC